MKTTPRTALSLILVTAAALGLSVLVERAAAQPMPDAAEVAIDAPVEPGSGSGASSEVGANPRTDVVVATCVPGTVATSADGTVTCQLAAPSQVGDPQPTVQDNGLTGDPTVPPPAPAIDVDDPKGTIAAIITFARSGKGRVAFGFALTLLVWAIRKILKPRVPWFGTQTGGYLLNFGTTAILFVAGALVGGVAITVNLIGDALAAGATAATAWHAVQDVKASAATRAAAAGTVSILLVVAGCYGLLAIVGCTT